MKTKTLRRIFNLPARLSLAVWCLIAAAAVTPCAAQRFRFDAPAVRGSRVTNLELVRKVFADAQFEKDSPFGATAAKDAEVRHLFGGRVRTLGGVPITLYLADRLETSDTKGGKTLWLIISVEQPEKYDCEDCLKKILAAFRVSKNDADLLDAADVQTGFEARFDGEYPTLKIAPGREAIVLWNFSYTYLEGDAVSLISAEVPPGGGFKVLLNQFAVGRYYRWDCDKWYEEWANLRLLKPARGRRGESIRNLEITVETKGGKGDYDFPKIKASRRFRYVFAWQAEAGEYQATVRPDEERRALVKRLAPDCPDR